FTGAPEIDVTPTSYNFGNVSVGQNASTTITINNTGTANLTVSNIQLTGAGFSLSGLPAFPANIPANGNLQFTATFAPTAVQGYNGTITISSNDSDEPSVAVNLTGNGVPVPAPEIDVTPLSYNYGNVTVGQSNFTTVTISNIGNANLIVSNIQVSGAGFSLSGLPVFPATISPNGNLQFTANFAPTAVQQYNGTVTISSNDADESVVNVSLTGTGVPAPAPEIDVTPMAHDYGNVMVGQTESVTITVNNIGNANLTIHNIQSVGAGFSLSGLPAFPATVAPNGNLQFTATFAPTAVQQYNGTVTISSNDADEPATNVTLTGNGVPVPAPEIDVSPLSYDFGTVTAGQTASVTITVTNIGNANLMVNNIQISGAGFSLNGLPAFPATVAPNGTLQFNATFAPTAAQAYSGTVTISSNDADEPAVDVSLTGNGFVPANPPEGTLPNPNPANAPWNPVWGNHPALGGAFPAFEASFAGGAGYDNPSSLNFDLDTPANAHPSILWDLSRLGNGYIGLMWVITPTGGSNFNATLTFRFLGSHLPGAPRVLAPGTPLYARGFNRSTLEWGYLFGHIPGEVTWTLNDRGNSDPMDDIYTVTVNGVTSFSDWLLSEDEDLPVQMSGFYANANDSRVNLSWVTESELNNAYFKIERRIVGGTWTEIARVNSRMNTSASRLTYSYMDNNVVNNTTYEYRISDVSLDGVISRYPRTVTATPRAEVIEDYAISNYPNPFNPETKISFTLREAGAVKLTITNVMGQTVATLLNGERMDRGTHNIVWNAGNLPSGIYLLRYEVNGFSTMSKLVLSR
ncbi:MAG: choice-of-anchor D domain-containing protein, partial [bacterium]|nr:choice-of-anchor D domain-containing protein [bacterium]